MLNNCCPYDGGLRWLVRYSMVWVSVMLGIFAGGASSACTATAFSFAVREENGQAAYLVVKGLAIKGLTSDGPAVKVPADKILAGEGSVVQGDGAQTGAGSSRSTSDWTLQQWHELLCVSVDSNTDARESDHGESDRQVSPIFGIYQLVDDEIQFRPRFAFRPNVPYRATLYPARLIEGETSAQGVGYRFSIANAASRPPTFVQAVYPTADVLPENVLKLYLRFSAPMRQAVALEHVRLMRADGTLVEDPFVNVGQELWDRSGEQLTLLFDPGRIKHGLRPRVELGPVLQPGADYVLLIDSAWNDANGQPLVRSFKKTFSVSAPDAQPPDPANWQIHLPLAGTVSPLEVLFNEPMDFALAQHSIKIVTPQGSQVAGKVLLTREEQQWHFTPNATWSSGEYSLVIDGRLEDRAGHSVGRPFETTIDRNGKTPAAGKSVTLSLSIE